MKKVLISSFVVLSLFSFPANSEPIESKNQQSKQNIKSFANSEISKEKYLKSFSNLEESFIGLDDFIKLRDSNPDLIILDVRPEVNYRNEHIKNAVNIDASSLTKERLEEVIPSKESKIVVYCSNSLFPTRMIALTTPSYAELYSKGYKNVHVLRAHYLNGEMNNIEKLRKELPLVK